MPICAQNLIQHQTSWVTASLDTPLDKAFTLMIEHEYSQLPVVDENFKALGLVTSESITRALLNLGASLKDIRVKDALLRQKFRQADEYLLDLLDSLSDSAALIVDGNDKLVGIITVHDTNQFFRERAEDIVRVEDIENALKKHLRVAYNSQDEESPELLNAIASLSNSQSESRRECKAALHALCSQKNIAITVEEIIVIVDKRFPDLETSRTLDDLTLYDFIQLGRKAWDKLGIVFNISVGAWSEMMDSVRKIRNKIMHFKGDVTAMERDRLRYCADWYTGHQPPEVKDEDVEVVRFHVKTGDALQEQIAEPKELPEAIVADGDGVLEIKYAPFATFLREQMHGAHSALLIPIASVEEIINQPLPKAAKEHSSWWTDESGQAKQWFAAGWRVSDVNLQSGQIQFRRIINRNKVAIEEPWEVAYWCQDLGCTEAQLREALRKVGPMAKAVKSYVDSPW